MNHMKIDVNQQLKNYHEDKSQISTDTDHKEDIDQFPSKFKTELCKNYTQNHYCAYGTKCRFAHGPSELMQNNSLNGKYKTKICFNYFGKSCCKYGDRCNYLHKIPTNQLKRSEKWNKIMKHNRQIVIESRTKSILFPN